MERQERGKTKKNQKSHTLHFRMAQYLDGFFFCFLDTRSIKKNISKRKSGQGEKMSISPCRIEEIGQK